MNFTEPRSTHQTLESTPQHRHRMAAVLHERAVKHHRHAAMLHEAGDREQAVTHGNIARKNAASALAAWDATSEI